MIESTHNRATFRGPRPAPSIAPSASEVTLDETTEIRRDGLPTRETLESRALGSGKPQHDRVTLRLALRLRRSTPWAILAHCGGTLPQLRGIPSTPGHQRVHYLVTRKEKMALKEM